MYYHGTMRYYMTQHDRSMNKHQSTIVNKRPKYSYLNSFFFDLLLIMHAYREFGMTFVWSRFSFLFFIIFIALYCQTTHPLLPTILFFKTSVFGSFYGKMNGG